MGREDCPCTCALTVIRESANRINNETILFEFFNFSSFSSRSFYQGLLKTHVDGYLVFQNLKLLRLFAMHSGGLESVVSPIGRLPMASGELLDSVRSRKGSF